MKPSVAASGPKPSLALQRNFGLPLKGMVVVKSSMLTE
jgi:hypothetical protein